MVNFTVQHILVMRLITQFNFPSFSGLQTLLFYASAADLVRHEIGFYDFVRTPTGVFSFSLQAIIEELMSSELVHRETFKLTEKGHNAYYALARVLIPFEDYWARCVNFYNATEGYVSLQKALRSNVLYRKARINGRLFPDY